MPCPGVSALININVATATDSDKNALIAKNQTDYLAYKATIPGLLAANDPGIKNTIGYLLAQAGVIGFTAVDIQLQADVTIGSLVANAVLGSTNDLGMSGNINTWATVYAAQNSAKQVLGSMYVGNMRFVLPAYTGTPYQAGGSGGYAASWVSISAH